MFAEHPWRVVGAAGAVVAGGLALWLVRPAETCVVEVPAVAPPPAKKSDPPPAIPERSLPCIADDTELMTDGIDPLLCWGKHCLAATDDGLAPGRARVEVGRPVVARRFPETPAGVAAGDRVCTGATCEPMGRALQAAVAAHGGRAAATSDRAAVVIGHELWNRAADQPIALPTPNAERELVGVDVVGDRVLLSHACPEWCSALGTLVDARGRVQGEHFATDPRWNGEGAPSIVDLGAGRFVLFGAFGETTLIEGGRRVATTTIAPHASPEDKVGASVEATAAIDRETLAYQWCGTNECHVGIVRVDGDAPEAERLRRSSEHVLPRCTP